MRHYIHIGPPLLLEEYQLCYVIIPRIRTIRACLICPTVLHEFIEYLDYSGDRPYDNYQPTVLCISHTRTGTIEPEN